MILFMLCARQQMDKQQLRQLHEFVDICKSKPEVLHLPELAFYRDWLQRYNVTCRNFVSLCVFGTVFILLFSGEIS